MASDAIRRVVLRRTVEFNKITINYKDVSIDALHKKIISTTK